MSTTVFHDGDEGVRLIIRRRGKAKAYESVDALRSPVHVFYGGADRFTAETTRKVGDIALKALNEYAPNFVEFANAMHLPGTEALPHFPEAVARLEELIRRDGGARAREENAPAFFAYRVYQKTIEKLKTEPIEDLRIDFEDGYGFRSDETEDADAVRTATELAGAIADGTAPAGTGIRIKPLSEATYARATTTLRVFTETLLRETNGRIPTGFVITLPKVRSTKEIRELVSVVRSIERAAKGETRKIGIEIMIESPEALIDRKGRIRLARLVRAGKGRVSSAHFGAFDYTSALGIAAENQSISHPACDLARNLMLLALSPLNIRLSDSVTTEMPVPLHRGREISEAQSAENRRAVHAGWREHFRNVSRSIANGFYQSWDLHPNQLVARYAAVYAFFLRSADEQANRLKRFTESATKATLTGSTFDDAASVRGLINFFVRGLDCGAFSDEEVEKMTGLRSTQIRSGEMLAPPVN